MRARILITTAVAACLALALPATAGLAKGKGGPVVVGTDAAGDWGANVDPNIAPLGDALGQDVVEASITMADATTVNFVIKVNALPTTGGIPENSRYTWDVVVDGNAFQISGAFTDFLRGVCNPLHTGACPPPQNPGMAPFFVRHGPCNVGADCFLDGTVNGTFDAAAATITIPIPLELIQAKPGSKIAPGVTSLGGTVYAAPAVMVTQASLPHDTMTVLKTFTVPKAKK